MRRFHLKPPKVPTVYYCDEIGEIVLIEKVLMLVKQKGFYTPLIRTTDTNILSGFKLTFDDCCYEYYEDFNQLKKEWPGLVKIGEL